MKIRSIVTLAIVLNILSILFVALLFIRYEFYSSQDRTSGSRYEFYKDGRNGILLNKHTGGMEYCEVQGKDKKFEVICTNFK